MESKRVRLTYHSEKMLQTLNLNRAFDLLFRKFGGSFVLEIQPMSEEERREVEETYRSLAFVRRRLRVEEVGPGGVAVRHEDIEQKLDPLPV